MMGIAMKDSGVPWIGKMPVEWTLTKASNVWTSTNSGEVIDKGSWGEGDCLLYTCAIKPMRSNFIGFPEKKRTGPQDLLLTRNATPYVHSPEINSIYSNVVQRIRVRESFSKEYCAFALQCAAETLVSYGVSIPSFNMDLWGGLLIPMPSLSAQSAIAVYLDRETSLIDQEIALIERKVALLVEYRKAVIFEAVTKGLDKNAAMKDSGVAWIGEMPAEWKIVRVSEILSETSKRGASSDHVLSASQSLGVVFQSRLPQRAMSSDENKRDNFKKVTPGQFVVSLRSFEGGVEYAWDEGIISPAYTVCQLKNGHKDYFRHLFKSTGFIEGLSVFMKGIRDGQSISFSSLRTVMVPFPDFSEQASIAAFLDQETAWVDRQIDLVEKRASLLVEYRKAIIFEAVTGKVEVPSL